MRNLNKFTGSKGNVLFSSQIVDRLVSGCPLVSKTVDHDIELNFAGVGDIAYSLYLKQNSNITINSGIKGQLQKMTVIVSIMNDSKVNFLSSILWDKNKHPFISSLEGSYTIIELIFDGYSKIFGREILNGNRI